MDVKSETTTAEETAAPKRDPATVAHEQQHGARVGSGVGSPVPVPSGVSSAEHYENQAPGFEVKTHMRPGHRLLTDKEMSLIQEIDSLEGELQQRFNDVMPELKSGEHLRCIALAKTNLQQAVMWATKAITQ